MEEKVNALKDVVDALGFMGRGEQRPDRARVFELLALTYKRGDEAAKKGEPIAWINFGVGTELFFAMDIVPLVDLVVSGTICQFPQGGRYIDIAHEHVPDYMCSANKSMLGIALAGEIPLPNVIVAQASPCDSNLAMIPAMAELVGVPYFCINVPYFRSERAYQHMANELRRLVSFLEEKTGRKLDLDKLRQVVEYSNLAQEHVLKLHELSAHIPCPLALSDRIFEYNLTGHLAGTPELVEYARETYEVAKARLEGKEEFVTKEKCRLVWIYVIAGFLSRGMDYLEDEYGAVNLTSMLHNRWVKPVDTSDYDKILRGLAENWLDLPMAKEVKGPAEHYIGAALDMCRFYKADGAVYAGHMPCKANWAIAKLTKDKIEDELNIPVFNFEIDVMDERVTSTDDIVARLEDFVKVVLQRKASRSKL